VLVDLAVVGGLGRRPCALHLGLHDPHSCWVSPSRSTVIWSNAAEDAVTLRIRLWMASIWCGPSTRTTCTATATVRQSVQEAWA